MLQVVGCAGFERKSYWYRRSGYGVSVSLISKNGAHVNVCLCMCLCVCIYVCIYIYIYIYIFTYAYLYLDIYTHLLSKQLSPMTVSLATAEPCCPLGQVAKMYGERRDMIGQSSFSKDKACMLFRKPGVS